MNKKILFIIGTYINSLEILKNTYDCVSHIKKFNKYDTLVVAHTYISEELQKISDYCFYDNRNLIWKGEDINYKVMYTFNINDIIIKTHKLNTYIPAVYYLTFPLTFAKNLEYDYAIYIDYDHHLISDEEIIECVELIEKENYSSIIYSTDDINIPMYTSFHMYNLNVFNFNIYNQNPNILKELYINENIISYENFYYNNFIKPNNPFIKNKINWDLALKKEEFYILPGIFTINKSTLSTPFYVLYINNNKLYFWSINSNKHNIITYHISGKDLNLNITIKYNIWYNLILFDINEINKENNFLSIKTDDNKINDFYVLNSDFINKINKETTVIKK
jgi:hypothetical protein